MLGILQPPTASSALPQRPEPESWRLEPLAGWHLPLLNGPTFLPLQPLLQRAILLGLPERVLHALRARPSLAPEVLVALSGQTPLGLIVTRRLNRSGSCWQIEHLRLAPGPGHAELAATLVRQAIQQAKGAVSWIATASTLDDGRLAMLREQGFQPLRTDRLWCWSTLPGQSNFNWALPADLQLTPLNRRSATLLWHLEQAACPARLRQLLDRRVEDLLDQSHGRGWMLVDASREQAVAAVRWIGDHPGGGHDVELSLHPGWEQLVGPASELLLRQIQARLGGQSPLWLRCDLRQQALQQWLASLGASERGERVLMARSVWRRQALQSPSRAARGLEAILEQWQPRRRPLPTPTPLAPP